MTKAEQLFEEYFETHRDGDTIDNSWLDRHCVGDVPLRGELLEMLRDAQDGRSTLSVLCEPDIGTLHQTHRRFDGFVLEKPLGGGGFGFVYKGYQESPRRAVAVKVLAQRLSPSDSFAREERFLTALGQAERIPDLYGSGTVEGFRYLAMEYIHGPTLEELLASDRRLSPRECRGVLYAIVDGMRQAQEKYREVEVGSAQVAKPPRNGAVLVHGDIKPANIVLQDGEPEQVKILDFGVAQLFDQSMIGFTRLYASPEMLISDGNGAREPLTIRSDFFQVGLIGYELLTRKKYWEVSQSERVSFLRKSCPLPTRKCLNRSLAWNPSDRFRSSEEFCGTLKRPILHPLAPWKFAARRPFASLFAVIVLGLVAYVGTGWLVAAGDSRGLRELNSNLTKQIEARDARISELETRSSGNKSSELKAYDDAMDGFNELIFRKDGAPDGLSRQLKKLAKVKDRLDSYKSDFERTAPQTRVQAAKDALEWLEWAEKGTAVTITPQYFQEWLHWRGASLAFDVRLNDLSQVTGGPQTVEVDEKHDPKGAPVAITWRWNDKLEVVLLRDGKEVQRNAIEVKDCVPAEVREDRVKKNGDYEFVFKCRANEAAKMPPSQ